MSCDVSPFLSWIYQTFAKVLSFTVFGILSSLLYSQHFNRYILQVFYVKFRSPHGTSNQTLYLIHWGRCSSFINHNRVQVLSYSKYSLLFTYIQSGTFNLQMIPLKSSLTKCPTLNSSALLYIHYATSDGFVAECILVWRAI